MRVTSVTDVKELIRYLRAGVSQRTAAEWPLERPLVLGLSRNTVAKYERELAKRGWLDGSQPWPLKGPLLPDEQAIAQMLKERFAPGAQIVSKLAPYQAWMEAQWPLERPLLKLHVSISKIHRTLNKTMQVSCAYSAVWEYVQQLKGPEALDITVHPRSGVSRVETAPGEEAQVDFGYGGWMYDPASKKLRKAWGFVKVAL